MIAILGSQFNYLLMSLLFPGAEDRYESAGISPEFVVGGVFLFVSFLLNTQEECRRSTRGATNIPLAMLTMACMCILGSIVYHEGSPRLIVTLAAFVMYFLAARFLASRYMPQLASGLGNLWLVTPVFLGILIHFYFSGQIVYITTEATGRLQPQISGGIRSTEVSLYAGLQVIYLTYCLSVTRNRAKKAILLGLIVVLGLLLMWLQSFAAVGGMVLVAVAYLLLIGRTRGLAIGLVLILLLGLVGQLFVEDSQMEPVFYALQEKVSELNSGHGKRGVSNSLLMSLASDNPAFGIGWGRFSGDAYVVGYHGEGVFPHNNILGMAAENGLPSAAFYILFMLSVLWSGVGGLLRDSGVSDPETARNVKRFLFMALACFAFIQWRGLFQDTWGLKESYLWAGIVVGISKPKWPGKETLRRNASRKRMELRAM